MELTPWIEFIVEIPYKEKDQAKQEFKQFFQRYAVDSLRFNTTIKKWVIKISSHFYDDLKAINKKLKKLKESKSKQENNDDFSKLPTKWQFLPYDGDDEFNVKMCKVLNRYRTLHNHLNENNKLKVNKRIQKKYTKPDIGGIEVFSI